MSLGENESIESTVIGMLSEDSAQLAYSCLQQHLREMPWDQEAASLTAFVCTCLGLFGEAEILLQPNRFTNYYAVLAHSTVLLERDLQDEAVGLLQTIVDSNLLQRDKLENILIMLCSLDIKKTALYLGVLLEENGIGISEELADEISGLKSYFDGIASLRRTKIGTLEFFVNFRRACLFSEMFFHDKEKGYWGAIRANISITPAMKAFLLVSVGDYAGSVKLLRAGNDALDEFYYIATAGIYLKEYKFKSANRCLEALIGLVGNNVSRLTEIYKILSQFSRTSSLKTHFGLKLIEIGVIREYNETEDNEYCELLESGIFVHQVYSNAKGESGCLNCILLEISLNKRSWYKVVRVFRQNIVCLTSRLKVLFGLINISEIHKARDLRYLEACVTRMIVEFKRKVCRRSYGLVDEDDFDISKLFETPEERCDYNKLCKLAKDIQLALIAK